MQPPAATRPLYTPVLESTGERLRIESPEFSPGFDHAFRGRKRKGYLRDPKTMNVYEIFPASCGLRCRCDARAVEIGTAWPWGENQTF